MPPFFRILRSLLILALGAVLLPVRSFASDAQCSAEFSKVSEKPLVPRTIELRALHFEALDAKTIREIKRGQEYSYLVDPDDRLILVQGDPELSSEAFTLIRDRDESGQLLLIKEAGAIRFDSKTGRIDLEPRFTVGLSDEEIRNMMQNLDRSASEAIERQETKEIPKSRMLECTEILNRQTSRGGYILNGLALDLSFTAGAIVVFDAVHHSGRSTAAEAREAGASLAGSFVASLLTNSVSQALVTSDLGKVANLSARLGTGIVTVGIQNGINRLVLSKDEKGSANTISWLDTGYLFARTGYKAFFDPIIMQKLPAALFESCLKDPKARIFVSPNAVRIYDKLGWTAIYWGTRKELIDSDSGKKQND